jgi:hypothetical protein
MTNTDLQTALNRINFYAKDMADHAKVAYWLNDYDNKEWHINQCKEALATLIELHESL